MVWALQPGSRMAELRAKNALTAASRSDYTLHGCRRGFVEVLYFLGSAMPPIQPSAWKGNSPKLAN